MIQVTLCKNKKLLAFYMGYTPQFNGINYHTRDVYGSEINAIKLGIPWSDLGSWKEISKIYNKHKTKYFNK